MEHLLIAVLISTGFAIWMGQGQARELLDSHAGRPLLGALGILIALGSYCWHVQDAELFLRLGLWFVACFTPVLVMGILNQVKDAKTERLKKIKPDGHAASA